MTTPNNLNVAPINEPSQTQATGVPSYDPEKDPFLKEDEETQTQMVLADFKAAYDWLETADVSGYTDKFVAFLNGKLVGTGPEQMELRDKVGREQQVHPFRVAVVSLGNDVVY